MTDNESLDDSGDQPKQRRSRTGCLTCRKRKKRCDENRPLCGACRRLRLPCEYPTPGLERKNKPRRTSLIKRIAEMGGEQNLGDEEDQDYSESHSHQNYPHIFSDNSSDNANNSNNNNNRHRNHTQIHGDSRHRGNESYTHTNSNGYGSFSSSSTINATNNINSTTTIIETPIKQSASTLIRIKDIHDYVKENEDRNDVDLFQNHLNIVLSHTQNNDVDGDGDIDDNDIDDEDIDDRIRIHDHPSTGSSGSSTTSFSSGNGENRITRITERGTTKLDDEEEILRILKNEENFNSKISRQDNNNDKIDNENNNDNNNDGNEMSIDDKIVDITLLDMTLNGGVGPTGMTPTDPDETSNLLNSSSNNGNHNNNAKEDDHSQLIGSLNEVGEDIDDVVYSRKLIPARTHNNNHNPNESALIVTTPPTTLGGHSPNSPSAFLNLDLLANLIPETPSSASSISSAPASWLSLKLDQQGQQLFDYFCSRQAALIAVAPTNSFLEEFVPMAMESDAVLYGIVAWAGFHKDRGHQQDVGYKYLNRAMQSVVASFSRGEITTLAGLLLILAGEICNGDVVHWSKHLSLAAKIINMNGGLSNFVGNKSLMWLAKNFAYHDLLAASTSAHRNPHFPSAEYDILMKRCLGPDTLLGCCPPLFQILAEISDLAVETQKIYNRAYGFIDPISSSTAGPSSMSSQSGHLDMLRDIRIKAETLEQKIAVCMPDHLSMITLTPEDLEQQLTFFEVFQLTARIHLCQSVLRLNASSLQIQCLGKELLTSLDVILGTNVEAGLAFPLFIAGISCCLPEERADMIIRFDQFYERNLARNIRRARQLLEEVWKRDADGTKHVDWYGIIESRGWDLCFA